MELGIVIEVNASQNSNAPLPKCLSPEGRLMDANFSHSKNTESPMVVTLLERVIVCKATHPLKVRLLISVRLPGSAIKVILLHCSKEKAPKELSPEGSVTVVRAWQL